MNKLTERQKKELNYIKKININDFDILNNEKIYINDIKKSLKNLIINKENIVKNFYFTCINVYYNNSSNSNCAYNGELALHSLISASCDIVFFHTIDLHCKILFKKIKEIGVLPEKIQIFDDTTLKGELIFKIVKK